MGDRYLPEPPRRAARQYRDRHDEYDFYGRYDQYDRYGRRNEYDRYSRSERPRSSSPPPPRHFSGGHDSQDRGSYTFRGAAARDDHRAASEHFSFRAPGPRFPSPDHQAPPPPPAAYRGRRGDHARRGGHKRGAMGQHHYGQRLRPPPPSSREILHEAGRASTPEQLEGMDVDGQVRFNALKSSSEDSGAEGGPRSYGSSSEEGEIRRKRFKVDVPPASNSGVPKWSNPDPYSVLPPSEVVGGPKKDIVQVIRKAKNDVAHRFDMTHAATQNADFISFTFGDDQDVHKTSTGQKDTFEDNTSDASSLKSSIMSGIAPAETTHAPNGNQGHPVPSRRSGRAQSTHPQRLSPIDLTDSPPRLPRDIIMPTDEELMQQYIGQPKGRKRKHDEQSRGKGDIVDAWQANWTDPTPWCTDHNSQPAEASSRLHQEIAAFYDFVRPLHHEETIRQDLIQRVQTVVRGMGDNDAKNVDVKCFGSFAAGLYLPTADMDLVAVSRSFMSYGRRTFCQNPSKLYRLVRHLNATGLAQQGTASAVAHAKVPIVKFTDRMTGIKVDISFENDSGLLANQTFQQWKLQYPAMPVIVVLIKQMLAMRNLNEVFTGGLGGFSIICLVVSMFQLDQTNPTENYADLLLNFLDLYGNRLDIMSTGITMSPPGYFDKINQPNKAQNNSNLTIIDPNNPRNDISGGSREVLVVFGVFRKAYANILQKMSQIGAGKDVDESILGCVLGGNYSSFIHQRNKLGKLFGGETVSPPPEPAPARPPRPQKRAKGKSDSQEPPSKHVRGNAGKKHIPGGSLSNRVSGGPPAKQGGLSNEPQSKQSGVTDKPTRNEARTHSLGEHHPGLASQIPKKLSKSQLKQFKNTHNIS